MVRYDAHIGSSNAADISQDEHVLPWVLNYPVYEWPWSAISGRWNSSYSGWLGRADESGMADWADVMIRARLYGLAVGQPNAYEPLYVAGIGQFGSRFPRLEGFIQA
jgi:hypothetical protein